jgi:predicted RNA-binding protein with PIN domain
VLKNYVKYNQLAIRADERVKNVYFTEETITVDLMDGRVISVPLTWYPRLLNATSEQREQWEVCGGGYGIHWEDIDEDLSTEGMLRGAPAPRASLANG